MVHQSFSLWAWHTRNGFQRTFVYIARPAPEIVSHLRGDSGPLAAATALRHPPLRRAKAGGAHRAGSRAARLTVENPAAASHCVRQSAPCLCADQRPVELFVAARRRLVSLMNAALVRRRVQQLIRLTHCRRTFLRILSAGVLFGRGAIESSAGGDSLRLSLMSESLTVILPVSTLFISCLP